MTTVWKTVRVFISSTFSDTHAERDHLVKVVFPSLRKRLEKYRIHLVDIDLRRGVTKEQADDDRALDLCLQQIDDCRPLFIGILGERYGYVPKQVPAMDNPAYGWVQEMRGKSITDLEIIHGVLNDREVQPRSFFYFRDKSFLGDVPASKRGDMLSDSEESGGKLAELKQTIRNANVPVYEDYPCNYSGLKINWRLARRRLDEDHRQKLEQAASDGIVDADEYAHLDNDLRQFIDDESVVYLDGLKSFGRAVHDQLWEAIRAKYNLPDKPPTETSAESDLLADEANYHRRFMESRLRLFVGREQVQRDLTKFANGDFTVPCLLTGPSGLGKSALLAKFVTEYELLHTNVLVIPHFIGASPSSASLRQMLHRFCLILKTEFSFEDEIPPNTNLLVNLFRQFVSQVPGDRRVLFVIDALNQLDDTHNAHTLDWVPWSLPSHVKFVASCLDDPHQDEPVLNACLSHKRASLKLKPLTDQERFEIVHQVPSLPAKTLDPEQVGLLLENPATTNPLFLLVTLEELRGFGSVAELNGRIKAFPREGESVTALFRQVIERLEIEFGRKLVHHVFAFLAIARRGLSESELQELLHADGPSENLFPLLCQARPYLQSRGNLIDFFHHGLYKAVCERYLPGDKQQIAVHRRLAGYFRSRLNPAKENSWSGDDQRAISELPYHQTQGRSWEDLAATLGDLRFIEAKCTARMTFDLVQDCSLALEALPELQAEREGEVQRQERLRQYGADLVGYANAKRGGAPLPTPPETREATDSVRLAEGAAADASGDSVNESQSARIKAFANFVSTQSHLLNRFPDKTCPIAFNHAADGLVPEQAGRLLDSPAARWLRRNPRPPVAAARPVCLWTLEGHSDSVTAVALTPDGKLAVSASNDNTLRVWDVASGELLRILEGHTNGVAAVALTYDGNRAVSASRDDTLRVWDVNSGKLVRTLEGHTNWVTGVALTPDGNRAVSASWDRTLRVWDVNTGESLQTLKGHTGEVTAVALTPDGNRAVSASNDNTLRVWDVVSGELLQTLVGHTNRVTAVALTPNGKKTVSASRDDTLRVWDVTSGKLLQTLKGHANSAKAVALTPDGNRAVSASSDKTLRVWDVATGELLRTLEGHTEGVNGVALTPDGNRAVSASEDETLRVWDVASGEWLRTLEGHADEVAAVALTPGGNRAVSAGNDNSLCVWDVASGELLQTLEGHTHAVTAVAMTRDGGRAVSASRDKNLCVWDVASGELLQTLEGHTNWVTAVALTADEKYIVSASGDKTLCVWDVTSGKLLRTLKGHVGRVTTVTLTPNGKKAVSAGWDRTLRVWDVAGGKLLRTLSGHTGEVTAVALTPDGKKVVSASGDKTLRVWDIASGKLLWSLKGHTGAVNAVALTPDGKKAVSASRDKALRVWDVANGMLLWTLEGHTSSVKSVALMPNGSRIVSTSRDKTLRVWDVASGELLRTLKGHTDAVNVVALTSDGSRAVSASGDATLRVWDVASEKWMRALEGHTDAVTGMALTLDGNRAVSASGDATLCVWNFASGKCQRTLEGHTNAVTAVALTPDGKKAVSTSRDQTIRVWDVASGEWLRTLEGHKNWVTAVTLTPDGKIAISASRDKTLCVWDVDSGDWQRTLNGHTGEVNGVAVASTLNGHRAVSASEDKALCVWNLNTGELMRVLKGHASAVTAVLLTPDGKTAISASRDKTLRMWDVPSGKLRRTLEGHTHEVTAIAFAGDGNRRLISVSRDETLRVWDIARGNQINVYPLEASGIAVAADAGNRIVAGTENGQLHFLTLVNCP